MLMSSPPARANVTWNVASGDWSVPTNWSGGAIPTSSVNANVYNGGTVNITTTGDVCSTFTLGGTGGGTVQINAGVLSISGSAYIGANGSGVLSQWGGADIANNNLYLGYNSTDSGTYTLAGSGLLSQYNYGLLYVGYSGTGNFSQSSGTNSSFLVLYLGYNPGAGKLCVRLRLP